MVSSMLSAQKTVKRGGDHCKIMILNSRDYLDDFKFVYSQLREDIIRNLTSRPQ